MWVNGHAWIVTQPVDVFHFIQTACCQGRTVFQREALRTGGLATKACAGR
jgi:hypothetical protein